VIATLATGTSAGAASWQDETSAGTSAPASEAAPIALVPTVSITPVMRVVMDESAAAGNL